MATRNTYIIAVILAIIVIVAISAFVLSSTTTPTTPTTTTTTPGGDATTATTITLTAENIKFNGTNPTITVKANTQVTITVNNKDSMPHNFIIQGVTGGSTNLLSPGQSGQVTVTLPPGTYKYYCSVHPGQMDGQIVAK
ncbi:MAG: cupredoxin domain-containing protein [Thaumarchaeota archaeon]|nr:cupredoxin domain-containing protein [Nitrososphaerota archaeon]MCL5317894.1 cupredoxin domain-containing protein [Nitrososphaerota archaeon]